MNTDNTTMLICGTEARGGLDARMVVKDAFTLDPVLNPDFSQVEPDEPQVTVNRQVFLKLSYQFRY